MVALRGSLLRWPTLPQRQTRLTAESSTGLVAARIGLQKAEMRHFAQQHLRTRMSEEGHQRRFKRKPRTSASPPIPDVSLRRTARRPNRLTRARRGGWR